MLFFLGQFRKYVITFNDTQSFALGWVFWGGKNIPILNENDIELRTFHAVITALALSLPTFLCFS